MAGDSVDLLRLFRVGIKCSSHKQKGFCPGIFTTLTQFGEVVLVVEFIGGESTFPKINRFDAEGIDGVLRIIEWI